MQVFKTSEFARIARRSKITDEQLIDAARRLQEGHVDANLGGGLYKQRVARRNEGKRGGHRVLLAFNARERSVFVYGFAKNERANIDDDELKLWRTVADRYLSANAKELEALIESDELREVGELKDV